MGGGNQVETPRGLNDIAMKVLVTGGAGYVGSHACKAFAAVFRVTLRVKFFVLRSTHAKCSVQGASGGAAEKRGIRRPFCS
jgi:nucleoside-diphosphate-sugar epimerase